MGTLRNLMNQEKQESLAANSCQSHDSVPLTSEETKEFDALTEEIRFELFNRLSCLMPDHPVGEANGYVSPAAYILPLLREGLRLWKEAQRQAFARIPSDLRYKAKIIQRSDGGGWSHIAQESPEARRMLQVATLVAFVEGLIDQLANEGKPHPKRNLKLAPHRRGDEF